MKNLKIPFLILEPSIRSLLVVMGQTDKRHVMLCWSAETDTSGIQGMMVHEKDKEILRLVYNKT